MVTDVSASPVFASSVYAERLRRAQESLPGGTAVVVSPGPDLRYLLGVSAESHERFTGLVIAAESLTVVLPQMELAILGNLPAELPELRVLSWIDGEDPYPLVIDAAGGASTSLLVGEDLPARHLVPLAALASTPPRLATPVLRELRMIKDLAEVDELRRAGAAIDTVHARVGEFLKPGRTEAEVAADIADAIVAAGHAFPAFIIVASGPNGADPHHEVSDKVIEAGEVVVVDIGGPLESGYNSDCTRTYVLGEPAADIAAAYDALERAQAAARDHAKPGVTAQSVDAAARDVLVEAGYGDVFVHRTGHGIGLSLHEEPYIVAGNDDVLRPGMAFSIEPGVYFKGRWGARLEDIVVLTETGAEPVNVRPRGLTVLPV